MLRKLIADHDPQCMAARSICGDRRSGPSLRPTTRPRARRCLGPRGANSACARSLRALGVPGAHLRRLRSRRRHRDAGDQVRRRRTTRCDRGPATRIFSTGERLDRIRVFNPRDEGAWYDEAGVKEKSSWRRRCVDDAAHMQYRTSEGVPWTSGERRPEFLLHAGFVVPGAFISRIEHPDAGSSRSPVEKNPCRRSRSQRVVLRRRT